MPRRRLGPHLIALEGLTSIPIVGGRKVDYLEDNITALDLVLSDEQHRRIGTAGSDRIPGAYIYTRPVRAAHGRFVREPGAPRVR